MKPKTLLIMLGLVLGLGAFIWFFEKDVPSTEERVVQEKKVLGGMKAEQVTAVAIVRDGKTVRFERDSKPAEPAGKAAGETPAAAPAAERRWRMLEPFAGRADTWAVDRVVDTLTSLGRESALDVGDRKELGLDAPRAKVVLTAGGKERTLEIGEAIPASSTMAVAVDGGAPAAVPNSVWSDLTKEPGEWRSKELFPGRRDDIERVAFTADRTAGGSTVVLVKKGDEFRVEAPVADRADRDAVNMLLGDLTALQATKFVDTPPPADAFFRDTVEVTFKGQASPWRLEIGAPAPAVPSAPEPAPAEAKPPAHALVRAGGVLAEVDSRIGETLRKPAAEWRSPRWASFEVFRVEALEVDDAQGHLALKRQDADWLRGSERIAFTPVSDVLYAVTGARGDRLLSRAEAIAAGATFTKPLATLKLIAADQSSETLSLYPALADGYAPAVASGRDEVVAMLNKTFVDDLTSKLQALRSAEPVVAKAGEGSGKQD